MAASEATISAVREAFGQLGVSAFRGQTRLEVLPAKTHEVLAFLKQARGFDFLVDITCVDYLNYRGATDRFRLIYLLANTQTNERITLRTPLADAEAPVTSVVDLWEGANWLEREVWDMFGIPFARHPDLRRILLPEEFTSYPLRKDYPLQGRGERHNFPVLRRAES